MGWSAVTKITTRTMKITKERVEVIIYVFRSVRTRTTAQPWNALGLVNNWNRISSGRESLLTLALSPSPAEHQVGDANRDRHQAEYDWPIHLTVSPLRVRSDCA